MKSSARCSRFAHLWLPRLSTDRVRRTRAPTGPLVLVEAVAGGLRLQAVDEAAAAEGLTVGMTLADARARLPALDVETADPDADLALLRRGLEACRRYTPALALHAPDGIDLDVTGCAALVGGEAALLVAAAGGLERQGLAVRAALADTPGLAFAAARFGAGGVVAAGAGEATLAPLPIAALGLAPEAAAVLRRLGLKRVGQLVDLPRGPLARRLGEGALARLDQALGRRASPLELSLERPPYLAERRMFEPISELEQVAQVARDLACDLGLQLDGRGRGARRFVLELFRLDGAVKRLEVAASRPLRDPVWIAALFDERLAGLDEGLQADFGFDQLRLTALATSPIAASTLAWTLSQETAQAGVAAPLSDLADRLTARTGARLWRPAPGDAHRPEWAARRAALSAGARWTGETAARFEDTPLRPLRLFDPPQPIAIGAAEVPEGAPARFTWRRMTRTVVRAEGPERLEPEWARSPAPDGRHGAVRDYYRLEDEEGHRYWVFRERRYDAPAAAPPELCREEIKPVRPAPQPPFRLKLVSQAPEASDPTRANPPIGTSPRANPRTNFFHAEEGSKGGCLEARPPLAPLPAWFLHGLFG